MTKSRLVAIVLTALLLLILLVLVGLQFRSSRFDAALAPIRIGVIHSLTGSMADNESPMVDAARLAVEEINAQGGLLGRPLEMVVADGKSDPDVFAAEAHRLIKEENVSALFGCWTSSCRKALKPIVEQYEHLLFYPLGYEGMEQSPHILYTGAAPNQQIIPGTVWALRHFGKRVYLVGANYGYSRMTNRIISDLVVTNGGEVLVERYLSSATEGSVSEVESIVADIRLRQPDVVFNTVSGSNNAILFEALDKGGLASVPLVSFRVSEGGMKAWRGGRLNQHYGVWSYFQSLPDPENLRFIEAYKTRFGADRVTSDPIVTSYEGVHLWAQAVREKGASDPALVNTADLLRQSVAGPSGAVAVDSATRHVWKRVRVGRVKPDGQFEQVFVPENLLRPSPWPVYRTRKGWRDLMKGLMGGSDT